MFFYAHLPLPAVLSSLESVPMKSHPTFDYSWVYDPHSGSLGLLLTFSYDCTVSSASSVFRSSNFRAWVQWGEEIEANVK